MRRLLIVLTALTLAGCRSADAAIPVGQGPPSAHIRAGADDLVVLPDSPNTFAEIARMLASARTRINVEMYEFGRVDLRDALLRAHERGVDVTVIIDPTVDVSARTAAILRSRGIQVVDYPVRPQMIDHVKLLVVDDAVAIVGGINWGERSWRHHDFDVEIRGPAVTNLARVFDRDLTLVDGRHVIRNAVRDRDVVVVSTLPRTEIGEAANRLIESSRDDVTLDAFVLTDDAAVHALIRARGRGVRVRVLLDPAQRSSDAAVEELRAAGVDVRLYRTSGELLHAKVVVVDHNRILFGSANWSAGGFRRNHEIDLEIAHSRPAAAAFLQQMETDWAASE